MTILTTLLKSYLQMPDYLISSVSEMKRYLVKVINTESRLVEVHGDTEESAILKAKDGYGNWIKFPVITTEVEVVQRPEDDDLFKEL